MTAGQAGIMARQPESHYIRSLVNVSVREALYGLSARCCYPVIQQATLRAEAAHIGEADTPRQLRTTTPYRGHILDLRGDSGRQIKVYVPNIGKAKPHR